MTRSIITPILIFLSGLGFSQTDIELNYQSLLGGNGIDTPVKIVEQNGHLVYGSTNSDNLPLESGFQTDNAGETDIYLAAFNDNELIFSTYFGGSSNDLPQDIVVNDDDEIILAGFTQSTDFPLLDGDGTNFSGFYMGFLSKLNSNNQIEWSTYVGGEGLDQIRSVDIDNDGNIYLVGSTSSENLGTVGTYQPELGNAENSAGFIAKYSPSGEKIWYSYFQAIASCELNGIKVFNQSNSIVVYGIAEGELLEEPDGYQNEFGGGFSDLVLASLDQNTGSLNWSTYFGGEGFELGSDLSLDNEDNIIISGNTDSELNISSPSAFQTEKDGSRDFFIAKFNTQGERLWGTYFGAAGSETTVHLSPVANGAVYLMGRTQSPQGLAFGNPLLSEITIPFPQSRSVFSKFSIETGQLIWSSYAPQSIDCASFRSMVMIDSQIHILGTFGQFDNYPECFDFTPDAFQSSYGGGETDLGIFIYSDNTLSSENLAVEPLNIYPNPTTDLIKIEAPNLLWARMELTVTDISGRQVDRIAQFQSGNAYSTSHLSEGVYILTGRFGERVFREKLLVQR
jgi:hypothetical protein